MANLKIYSPLCKVFPSLLHVRSCYTVALTEERKYGRGAPFGGLALIGAWLAIAVP